MSERTLELARRADDGTVHVDESLAVRSGRDVIALLLEAAEDLCLQPVEGGFEIHASDVRPFVLPRLDELLDPENEELRMVLAIEGREDVKEHTIKVAVGRGEWPKNGSATLEAAVLPVKLRLVARKAAEKGESVVLRWR